MTSRHLELVRRRARKLAAYREVAVDAPVTTPGYGRAFMRWYLPHYMKDERSGFIVPPAEWHNQFHERVFGTLGQGVREVFLAPRGYAKSTVVSLETPLIAAARQLKRYVLMVQETGPQAAQAMGHVIAELDTNDRLLADFPHLARLRRGGRVTKDTDMDVILASGFRLQAVGAGGSLRGRRNREQRPDLVLIDDLEDDEHVQTAFQREKLDGWVSSALMGALSPASDVYMVGTLLHHDAVLARLMGRGAPWRPHTYHAVHDTAALMELVDQVEEAITSLRDLGVLEAGEWNEDAIRSRVDADLVERVDESSTWPQLWGAMRLVAKRKEMGSFAFAREYLHQPVDESRQMFPRSRFRYSNMRERLLMAEPGEMQARVRIGVDPAVGEKRENDYTAIVVTAQVGSSAEYHVVSAWRGRKRQADLVSQVAMTHDLWRPYSPLIRCETVQAQAWLAQALRERPYGLPVESVVPTRDKITRAEPLGVLYENGQVLHDDGLRDGDFELELTQFPAGEHDDYVDAHTMATLGVAHGGRLRIEVL